MSRNTFRWKPYIFWFRQWGKVSIFFRKLYDWFVKTAFQLAIGSFWDYVSAVIFLPINFGHWAKALRDFVKKLSTGWSKLNFSCPEELFELNKFCKSCRVLFITLGLSDKKNLAFWQKKFAGVVKRPFYMFIGPIQGDDFLWIFFCHFRNLIGKFPLFVKKISSGSSELVSSCHKNHDEAEINLKKSF